MSQQKPHPRNNKSPQQQAKSAARKAVQQQRGTTKFVAGSNKHNGASISQSGQKKR